MGVGAYILSYLKQLVGYELPITAMRGKQAGVTSVEGVPAGGDDTATERLVASICTLLWARGVYPKGMLVKRFSSP